MGHTVPLEVMPAGQFEPLYRTPLRIQVSHSPTLLYGDESFMLMVSFS
jgi:hypothetical protein